MAKKWSYNLVKEFIESKGCLLISKEYTNMKTKLEIKCKCGEIYKTAFDSFVRYPNCIKCGCKKHSTTRILSNEYVKGIVESEGYELLNTYINAKNKIKVRCDQGHEYEVTFNNFTRRKRCKTCQLERLSKLSKKKRISLDVVIKEIEKDNFRVVDSSEFEKSSSKILLMCDKGYEYKSTWNRFQSGKRCPFCKSSKGENSIVKFLNDNQIEYKREYRFDECRNKRRLPFDFYIEKYNVCIEYDGEFHYKEIDMHSDKTSASERLKYTHDNDLIKDEYCKNNKITLIRIPYWEFNNIEEILTNNLIKNFND